MHIPDGGDYRACCCAFIRHVSPSSTPRARPPSSLPARSTHAVPMLQPTMRRPRTRTAGVRTRRGLQAGSSRSRTTRARLIRPTPGWAPRRPKALRRRTQGEFQGPTVLERARRARYRWRDSRRSRIQDANDRLESVPLTKDTSSSLAGPAFALGGHVAARVTATRGPRAVARAQQRSARLAVPVGQMPRSQSPRVRQHGAARARGRRPGGALAARRHHAPLLRA